MFMSQKAISEMKDATRTSSTPCFKLTYSKTVRHLLLATLHTSTQSGML